ncbi:FBD-associated F-box protein At4g10400 [Arachis hypogaea]|uniref:FBD-associated F-box protein At4g10400 n=1 Tax=Arachis hypogaea TaxID=3818 RepID=UPI000DEE0F98|nr:FBD-associated F-box protein At4g10400 [Arachis hypogaea]
MDRISNLPDCILLHILSFLPTKTAFFTAVLSRRWTHLCHDLQHFDFNQIQFHNRNQTWSDFSSRKRLFATVNWILSRHKAPPIRTFRLTCNVDQFDQSTVEWFIRKVFGPNLEELNLQLSLVDRSYHRVFISNGVLSCTSLVTLRLNGGITIPSPLSSSCPYHLPSLKTLQLYNVVTSVGNLEEILSHCTALETLILDSIVLSREGQGQLRICFPSLKSLHSKSCFWEPLRLFVIDTPSLKRLDIQVESGFREIRVRNLHNVEEASINLPWQFPVLKFLVKLCRIRILVLRLLVFDCLPDAPPHLIPEFTCLQRLELTVRCFDTRYIMDMLQKCPMLKLLAVVFNASPYDKDPLLSRKWEHPVKVPTCLASHLQLIKIKRYFESRDDRDFFAYVLQHGLVLESLDIQVDRARAKGFPEELFLFPRSSKACQINFCWNQEEEEKKKKAPR